MIPTISDARLREILDNLLEGCQIIDRDYKYIYLNNAIVEQSKQSREELLGETMMERYPGIEETEVFALIKDAMENKVPHKLDNWFTFPDNTKGYFKLSIQPIREGVLIFSIDITDLKRTEKELEERVDELEGLYSKLLKPPGEIDKEAIKEVLDKKRGGER